MGHNTAISRPCRAALLASALAATLALGGCGGIEFQGKVFDYMGLSGDRQEPDVKMAERPPLLLPPDTKALPQPGSGVAGAPARAAWPDKTEKGEKQTGAGHKAEQPKENTDPTDPINPLQGKSNPLIDKWLSKNKKVVQPDETPEPDPTDKPMEGETVAQSKPKPLPPHVPQELPPPTEDPFHPAPPESYKNPDAIY